MDYPLKDQLIAFIVACGPVGATAAQAGQVINRSTDHVGQMLRQYASTKGVREPVRVFISKRPGRTSVPLFFAKQEWRDAYERGAPMLEGELRDKAAEAVAEMRQMIENNALKGAAAERVAMLVSQVETAKAAERAAKDRCRSSIKTRDAKIKRLELEIAELKANRRNTDGAYQPVVTIPGKSASYAKAAPIITSDTKVTIAPTPRGRFDPEPGHVGQFASEWLQARA